MEHEDENQPIGFAEVKWILGVAVLSVAGYAGIAYLIWWLS